MPRTVNDFFLLTKQKIKKFYLISVKKTNKIFFKTILVPTYKFFLFIKKESGDIKKTHDTISNHSKTKPITQIIFIFIIISVVLNNFSTKETYAEELNKNNIISSLFTDEFEEVIVEKSPILENNYIQPKSENILQELVAISADHKKGNINDEKIEENNTSLAMAENGDAAIKPLLNPFGENTPNTKVNTNIKNTNTSTKKEIRYYTVKKGDSLSVIAENYGVSINTILWENNLSPSSYIRPGDKLAILPIDGVTYKIKSGDTLSAIANKYNTSVTKIIDFNELGKNDILKVGQKLIIPDGKLGASTPTVTRSIGSISNAFKENKSPASSEGFIWPSVSKRITQYYHYRHTGLDIGAKTGTPIYAMQSGRIERSGWSTGYGYNIIVDHGNGVKTLYAHASKLYVKRGDQVEQGEVIGAVGSTGWSTGPHIHLEVRINGRKMNPLSYL